MTTKKTTAKKTSTKKPGSISKDVAPKAAATPAPKASKAPTPKAAPAPTSRDARLPAVGTVLRKLDRHGAVRCECTVVAEGIRYKGTTYTSISAAAMAAARDLGLKNKTFNGFTWWGLSKPTRPASDPLADRAWARIEAIVANATDQNRAAIQKRLRALVAS